MALTLQQIIDEAETLVPNEVDIADQIIWLNNINQDFFNIVKIPRLFIFNAIKGMDIYLLPTYVQERNVDLCIVGVLTYRNAYEEPILPLQNRYGINDATQSLHLNPPPYADGLHSFIRYHRTATTTFLSSNLNAVPDAPEEIQWTYIPALAAYLANTQDDSVKASNYEQQYKSAWNAYATNYQGGAVNP